MHPEPPTEYLIILKIYLAIFSLVVAKNFITVNSSNILKSIALNDIRLIFLIVYVLSLEIDLKFLCLILFFISWEFIFNILIPLRYRTFIGVVSSIVTLSLLPLILLGGKNPIFIDFCIEKTVQAELIKSGYKFIEKYPKGSKGLGLLGACVGATCLMCVAHDNYIDFAFLNSVNKEIFSNNNFITFTQDQLGFEVVDTEKYHTLKEELDSYYDNAKDLEKKRAFLVDRKWSLE